MSFGGFGKESGPAMPPKAHTPFGHFPHPPSPSPPPPAPLYPSSVSPLSGSPRSFVAYERARSPLPFDNSQLSTGPRTSSAPNKSIGAHEKARSPFPFDNGQQPPGSHMPSMSSRAASSHLGKNQSLPFGGSMQKRSPAHGQVDTMTSISSKFPHSQDTVRSRSPVQYTDDFLADPVDAGMEVGSSSHLGKNQSLPFGGSMQKRSPAYGQVDTMTSISSKFPRSQDIVRSRSPVQYTDDFLADPIDVGMEVPTSSPPKSRTGTSVPRMPDYKNSSRLSPAVAVDGPNDDISVKKYVGQPVPKRNRSPSAMGAGHLSQISFSNEDDAERELQAKARRLARFKTELNEGEPSNPFPYGLDVAKKGISSMKADQSSIEKKKFPRDVSRTTEEVTQENDNEDLQTCSVIVGICPDMCPESERAERERKGDLDQYERVDGDRNQTSKALAVKKYNRTAEREAELIRPMSILRKTMDYLLGLLDQPYDDRFLGLYNFLWDRMRAIRMDLRMQHIFDHEAITMLEQMIRLHIIAMHELCEFSKGEGFSEGFDAHLNIEQMNKTSVELFQLYDDHRKRGIFIPTEKEFRGYYALLKLDKHPGYKVEPAELSLDLAKMTTEIRQTHEVLFARDVARSCRTSNFIAFFRHARRASYLQACLIHAHFSKLRTQALASLHAGLLYNQGLPVSHVSNWLGMEGEDIESLLEYHGFSMKEFEEPYMVKEGPFLNADKDYPTRCSMLVHGKKSNKIVEDILSSHQPPAVPSKSKKELHLDKSNKHKHIAVQPTQTKSSVVPGVMEKDKVSSPRNNRQVKAPLDTSKTGDVYMAINHSVPSSSPKSNARIPRTFSSFQENSKQGQPSPATPKGSSVIVNDGELSGRNPLWNVFTPQPVHDKQPAYVEQPREIFHVGLASFPENSSELVAPSEVTVMNSDMRSADVKESVFPTREADSGYVSSSDEELLMEEETRNELLDDQQNVENDDGVDYYDQEVAEAKLKLFIRLWRRRFARKKELREQNRLAANAALSSLSLGPPIHHNKNKPTSIGKLNIDEALSKRYEKRQQSWARCNISELVAAKLGEKNAYSSCICWKVVVFSWLHWEHVGNEVKNPVTQISLDQWLQYKLIPSQKDDTACDLVTSAPGMAIWRKWFNNVSGCGTCCLSVIKDAKSGNVEKNLLGTSALLFAVSDIVPWELQRVQLHNLVMSLPAGARVPLLIVSGSIEDNVSELSSIIVDKLGLKDIDNSRVGSFLVKCVNERDNTGHLDGYFSDQNLKEGFTWLASKTPSQPVLYHVTLRDLVSSHLNMCLDAFNSVDINKLGPNSYISVFNEALDRSVNDILAAANMNPTHWPCPELYLLDNSISEFKAVRQFLPNLGWSSCEEVEPLVSLLRNIKLPFFSDDLGWLSRDCNTGKDIEEQRHLLHDCLIRYLTQSHNIMNSTMAAKEASVMLQQCVRLELLSVAVYKVVPNWSLIFRRILSWQLNTLANINRKAYVLEQSHSNNCSEFLEKLEFEASRPHYISHPSLDEMVEVSCSPIGSRIGRSAQKSIDVCKVSTTSDTSVCTVSNNLSDNGSQFPIGQVHTVNLDVNLRRDGFQVTPSDTEKDADRLSNLLDRCNMLQDEIENKLSIFF